VGKPRLLTSAVFGPTPRAAGFGVSWYQACGGQAVPPDLCSF